MRAFLNVIRSCFQPPPPHLSAPLPRGRARPRPPPTKKTLSLLLLLLLLLSSSSARKGRGTKGKGKSWWSYLKLKGKYNTCFDFFNPFRIRRCLKSIHFVLRNFLARSTYLPRNGGRNCLWALAALAEKVGREKWEGEGKSKLPFPPPFSWSDLRHFSELMASRQPALCHMRLRKKERKSFGEIKTSCGNCAVAFLHFALWGIFVFGSLNSGEDEEEDGGGIPKCGWGNKKKGFDECRFF